MSYEYVYRYRKTVENMQKDKAATEIELAHLTRPKPKIKSVSAIPVERQSLHGP
jgi:hypothetical protein